MGALDARGQRPDASEPEKLSSNSSTVYHFIQSFVIPGQQPGVNKLASCIWHLASIVLLLCTLGHGADPCMNITTFTNKMTGISGWDTHYKFFSELEGCRDGMYAIKLESMSVEYLQTQWEQLWKKDYIKSDTAYFNLVVKAVHSAREDEKDGGEPVNVPVKCPDKAPKQCAVFLARIEVK